MEVLDDFLNDLAEFVEDLQRVVSVYASNQIGTLADISIIFCVPLNPLMVLIADLHSADSSIALRACHSW
tara:strand:+ start:6483 stop:6692 length:210 start_codon:yes stop_codon:yes gene_type:complete